MGINSNYYSVNVKDKAEIASAFAPEETKLAYELISDLEDLKELPFELSLVKLTTTNKGLVKSENLTNMEEIWLDYQPNSLAWPLFSEKVKLLVEENLTGQEGVNWIRAKINFKEESRYYYIPRFGKKLDVLNKDKSMFVPGTTLVIKPYFSLKKILDLNMFNKPSEFWQITPSIYFSEKIKTVLQQASVIGIKFNKTLVD